MDPEFGTPARDHIRFPARAPHQRKVTGVEEEEEEEEEDEPPGFASGDVAGKKKVEVVPRQHAGVGVEKGGWKKSRGGKKGGSSGAGPSRTLPETARTGAVWERYGKYDVTEEEVEEIEKR